MTKELELKLWQVLAEILSDKYNLEIEVKEKNKEIANEEKDKDKMEKCIKTRNAFD